MKNTAQFVAWTFVAGIIVFAALNPTSGVIFQSPSAAVGLGLIGLGLCMEARKKMAAQAQLEADRKPRR